MILYQIFHNLLHILLPLAVVMFFYRKLIFRSWIIMLSAYLIDIDHLLADPVFDPGRCSIGFHPLHSYYAIGLYLLLTAWTRSRIIGLGLVIHIFVDFTDCVRIYFN